MKYGLIGIIYFTELAEKESFDYFMKDLMDLFSKYMPSNVQAACTYIPIIQNGSKVNCPKIESPNEYKSRVTLDWGVEVVNDLEILKKEKKKRFWQRKKKKEKDETK